MGKKKLEHIVFDNTRHQEFNKLKQNGKPSMPYQKMNSNIAKPKTMNMKRGTGR